MRALSLASVLAVGCTGGVSALDARLVECGLVSEGELGPTVTASFYQPDDCYRGCLAEAECEELRGALCATSIDALRRCDGRCAHRCANGALVVPDARCDGRDQCGDGSDEEGCETFECGGVRIAVGARCNGSWDCPDGADERGCTGSGSVCTGLYGEMVYEWARCDGVHHCRDGADERGCGEHVCADGQTIPHRIETSLRCDGWSACRDRSDEEGCATLTPMCAG